MEGDVIYKLPAELWISIFQLTAPVFYEQDRSAKAHIRIHFRNYPLHRVRDSIPCVYKEKYAICKNIALTCSTFARLITPVLFSHAFLRGDFVVAVFLETIRANPAVALYVKALVLLSEIRISHYHELLVSMLPNLKVLHMTPALTKNQINYPPSIEVLDLCLRYNTRGTAEVIQISFLSNLRILSLQSLDDFPTSFDAACLSFPSLSALDITGVNNPVLLSVFPTWIMPKLFVLCMTMPAYEYLLVDLLKAVSRTIHLLQLALNSSMKETSGHKLALPRLKELTIVARSMATPHAMGLRVLHSLPALQLLNIAQPKRSASRLEHTLDAALEVVYGMVEGWNPLPKALESIRVWESRQHDMKDLVTPLFAYQVIRNHEARFRRVGVQLMVIAPSGVYMPARGAYRAVVRI